MYQSLTNENDLNENKISIKLGQSIDIKHFAIMGLAGFTNIYIYNNEKANNSKGNATIGYIDNLFNKYGGFKTGLKRNLNDASERQTIALDAYKQASHMLLKNESIEDVILHIGKCRVGLFDGKKQNSIFPSIYKNLEQLFFHAEKFLQLLLDFQKVFSEKVLFSEKEIEKEINPKLRKINIQAACNVRELLLVWILAKAIMSLYQVYNVYYRTQNIIDDGKIEKLISGPIRALGEDIGSMITGRARDQERLLERIARACLALLKVYMKGKVISPWVFGEFVSIIENAHINPISIFSVYKIMKSNTQPPQIAIAFKESKVKIDPSAKKH